eukprot:1162075-Pelagomonas_calceolata.AAC.4
MDLTSAKLAEYGGEHRHAGSGREHTDMFMSKLGQFCLPLWRRGVQCRAIASHAAQARAGFVVCTYCQAPEQTQGEDFGTVPCGKKTAGSPVNYKKLFEARISCCAEAFNIVLSSAARRIWSHHKMVGSPVEVYLPYSAGDVLDEIHTRGNMLEDPEYTATGVFYWSVFQRPG